MIEPLRDPAAVPGVPVPDVVQEWIFTFGAGQRLVPYGCHRNPYCGPTAPDEPEGLPLADRFVRITGTYLGARQEMHRRFGSYWCDQYPSEGAAGVVLFGLRELT